MRQDAKFWTWFLLLLFVVIPLLVVLVAPRLGKRSGYLVDLLLKSPPASQATPENDASK